LEAGLKLENRATAPSTPAAAMSAVPCVGGMAGPYPCDKIDLLAFVPIANLGSPAGTNGNVVEAWTDPLDGTEYALVGLNNGVAFVDVSDPVNPVFIGKLPPHNGVNSLWRDVRVYNDRAYVGS